MPRLSQPAALGRVLEFPEPPAPPSSRAVLPEYADEEERQESFELGPLFRTWSWTWTYWPWSSYWPDLRKLARDGFFRPAELHWTSNQVQCYFCGVQVDKWEPDDDINEVHIRFRQRRVGATRYGTRHSRGCLFALHRRQHPRCTAGLSPTAPRRTRTGLYRSPGREVSGRGEAAWSREPWWNRGGRGRELLPEEDGTCLPDDVTV